MKKYFFLLVFAFSVLISCNSNDTTTYYLIRHAEKEQSDKTNRNPHLNSEGEKRAHNWSVYFKDINIESVYSTNYNRTIQTATPTAKSKKLEINYYNPANMYDSIFKAETKGKSVLVVGHSNTTPVFANKILGKELYQNMNHDDNYSLYIVTVKDDLKNSTIEKVNE